MRVNSIQTIQPHQCKGGPCRQNASSKVSFGQADLADRIGETGAAALEEVMDFIGGKGTADKINQRFRAAQERARNEDIDDTMRLAREIIDSGKKVRK